MPPKLASTTEPRCRSLRTTPRKSIPIPTTSLHIHLPSSTTTTAIPSLYTTDSDSLEFFSEDTRNTLQDPPHSTTPAYHAQSQISPETLASNSELGQSCDLDVEAATAVDMVNLSSPPVEKSDAITETDSAVAGVAGSRSGKRKIVRKTVRVVKKIVKRRVPKRSLMNGSENQVVGVKAVDGADLIAVRDQLNIANDAIGNFNIVDKVVNVVIENSKVDNEVVGKTSVVNKANDILSIADDSTETLNRVNEKSDHVDEVMEKENIRDEVTQKLELVNAPNVFEPIIGEKGNDLNGIAYMESDRSKLNFIASFSEHVVSANDLSGINSKETDNIKSNDVVREVDRSDLTIHAPDFMEVEKTNDSPGCIMETKEIANAMMMNKPKDLVDENEKVYTVNTLDVELLACQTVGSVATKSVVLDVGKDGRTNGEAESGGEMESDRIRLTEGLLLSGEMEALARKKRRRTEIFLGGLDKDTREEDIRKVFGEAGVVVEVRLVMSKTGKNRGYAFVRFATAADAKNALSKYSEVKICGKQCTAAPVEGNDTIFLGNIDRNWKTEDVVTLLEKAGIEKIDNVTYKVDPNNIEKNRGFAFVEFQTCKDAQTAFNKLQKKDVFGKKQMVKIAWAQPLIEPDEEEILQVKSVFAEFLPSSWDEEIVKDYFKRFGEIENVVLAKDLPSTRRKDFAFINFTKRDAALTCIEAVSRERLEDDCSKVKMAVYLAKPVSMRKQLKHTSDLIRKQPLEGKQKAFQTSKNLHEPRKKGRSASSSYNHVHVDNNHSTTDELVNILRQQASNKHILSHPRTGTDIPDPHVPLPGSKRPFSLVGHDPLYVERQGFSQLRVGSSYPISGPSSSLHGVGMLSFPYHHQQGPALAYESVNERRIYPSHFQTREQAPYFADNNTYRRY